MPENTQYDRVREITDQLETGLAALFESDAYKTYLTTLSKFHDYSLNNTILIAMQKPDATLVAGYTAWQKQFGRQVNKGEKAIRILAPTPYKQKVEVDKTDPNTGEILFNPDGSTQKEVQEILRPAFKVVSVFDVSQTDGRELPTIGINELTGDVQQFEMFFEALKRTCPVPMEFEQISSGAKGYYHQLDRRIAIQIDMSQVQTVKTAIHEMAHQKLHAINPELGKPEPGQDILTRNGKEVEAESVAYTVCQHYGIDTSDYSFAYIAGWSQGKETPELKASLNTIRTAASEMISEIDGHMQELQQERDAKAADLAEKLDDFAEQYDPYDYYDAIDDREAAVLQLKADILEGGASAQGIIDHLQEIVDEGEDQAADAAMLIAQIKPFMKKEPVADHEDTSEKTEAAFRVGDHFLEIHEAVDGSWDFTVYGHNYREIDGGQIGESGDMTMDYAVKEVIDFYQLSGQPITEMNRDLLGGLTDLYDPTKCDDQIHFMGEMLEQGFDPHEFWVNSQPMDLTAQRLSPEQVSEIQYQMQIDAIPRMLYTKEQWQEIQTGIQAHLEVWKYTNPQKTPEEMRTMRLALSQPPVEPTVYRYYSTQRPVDLGTFPKPEGNKPTSIHNYDERQPVEDGSFRAWGYVEYAKPLTKEQLDDYELRDPKAVPEKTTERKPKSEKKSVMADLRKKQAQVAGKEAQKQPVKSKSKEMD